MPSSVVICRALRACRDARQKTLRQLKLESLELRRLMTANAADGGAGAGLLSQGCGCPICSGQGLESWTSSSETYSPPATTETFANSVPALSSNSSATAKLYLNFTGRFDATWGAWSNFTTPAFDRDGNASSFSTSELSVIQQIWARVAEDFAPFNIDVTTIDPGSLANRVVAQVAIGGNGSWYGSAGGVAYVGGFYNSASNVGFVFEDNLANGDPKYTAEAASHEAGHLFGLSHQSIWSGTTLVDAYNPGNANWAPVMGVGYSAARSTWHNGTSSSATTYQDDIAVLSNASNGFGLKADDFGSTLATASALSISAGSVNFAGLIGHHTDSDVWQFTTAGGSVSFSLSVAQYGANLDATLELYDANGTLIASAAPAGSFGASLSRSLTSGSYYLVAKSDGVYGNMGQYTLTGTVPQAPANWGSVAFFLSLNRQVANETWYTATASQAGLFSAEAYFAHAAGNVDIEIYNASNQLLGTSATSNNAERVDLNVTAGQELRMRVIGTNSNVTFRCVNLVSASGNTIYVTGTLSDDLYVVLPGTTTHRVAVNGVGYDFDASTYTTISYQDPGGIDTLVVLGTLQDETANVSQAGVTFTGSSYSFSMSGAEFVQLYGSGGNDTATLMDRAGNDTFIGSPTQGTLSGTGYSYVAYGFDVVDAQFTSGGFDQAFLYGSIGDDQFDTTPTAAVLVGPGFRLETSGFDTCVGVGGAGNDIARLSDTTGDETYIGYPDSGAFSGANFYIRAELFDRVEARSTGGLDVAYLWDSPGDDYFGGSKVLAFFNGVGFSNYVEGFDRVTAISRGGNDTADVYDTAGDDSLSINGRVRRMESSDYFVQTENFRTFRAHASVGNDTATIRQLGNTDTLRGQSNWLSVSNGEVAICYGFDQITTYVKSGQKPRLDLQAIDYLFSKIGW